jgi:predicted aspartyl protease
MISGSVSDEGELIVDIAIAGQVWPGVIDTGFNGDVLLPEACRSSLSLKFRGAERWILANN